ncbi:hypothetical protein JCM8097_004056 [Rhodosporidiobolus ruineniae]
MARLLDLPPELLALVFSFVGLYDKAGKRPVCRALLPYTRRNLLERVTVYSPPRLDRLSRLLRPRHKSEVDSLDASLHGDVPLGLHVRELDLPRIPSPRKRRHVIVDDSDEEEEEEEEEERSIEAELKAIRRILSAVKHVEILQIAGSATLEILFPSKRTWAFPRLHSLRLLSVDSEYVKAYDMSVLGRLRRFPALKSLEYRVRHHWENPDLELVSLVPVRAVLPLPKIETLELSAGVSLSMPQAANFVSHFSSLQNLNLSLHDLAELTSFFASLPVTLTSLTVAFDCALEIGPDDPGIVINPHLTRLVRLESLILGIRTWSSGLFRVLSTSLPRLEVLSLECGEDPDLDASRLIRYLSSCGGYVRNLRHLSLDAFSTYVDFVPSEGLDDFVSNSGVYDLEASWTLPGWTRTFSYEHAKEIVAVAEARGVRLDGSMLEAIEVHEMRDREERFLQEKRDEVLEAVRGLFGEA